MAWGEWQKPSFDRRDTTLEEIRDKVDDATKDFLSRLDWTKTAIFYEKSVKSHSGVEGYRIVHFREKVEEKWHNIIGHTWIGISAWMS